MEPRVLIRRHFFLFAALLLLLVMIVAGGWKLLHKMSGAGAQGGPPGMAQGGGASGGVGGAGRGGAGGRGGFGGPPLVSVSVVAPQTFEDTIEVLGVAKGRQSVTLTAATTQLVERVRFVDGQRVARGQVLVELKDTEQDAGLAQAEARQVQAKRAYDRYKTLGDQGFASKAAMDQFEANWRATQADVNAARARQSDRVIRAPFSGVVGLSDVAPGALVNPGAPIVTLDDVSVMRVDFQVPERDLAQLRVGQTLLATSDAFPGTTITGRIAKLDTRVDERTRAITARAEFTNADGRLKPGMLMRVGVSRGSRTGPAAPEAAVSVQGETAFVYVIRQRPAAGGRPPGAMVEQRTIVTGARQNGFVEIREGAKVGDKLVADGLNKIQPGMPVRVKPARGPEGPAASGASTGGRPMAARPAP